MQAKTAGEILTELDSDPAYRLRQEEQAARAAANRAVFIRAARPVLADLEAVGIDTTHFANFVNRVIPGVLAAAPFDSEAAAPILLKHLETTDSARVREVMISRLKLRSLRGVADEPLLRAFRRAETDALRWRIADTLQTVASKASYDQITELAGDRRYGPGRAPLVDMLWRIKSPEAERIIEASLDDPDLARSAMSGWKRLRDNAEALVRFEKLSTHPNPRVAEAARDYARRTRKSMKTSR